MPEVYVGLGSNVDPERHLRAAVAALRARFGAIRASAAYRSAAVEVPAETGSDSISTKTQSDPDFREPDPVLCGPREYLNLVVELRTEARPRELVAILKAIEADAGRSRAQRDRATLDLDLLLYGRRVDGVARLPRADVLEAPFVLAPLAELAPTLVHPVTGATLGSAWAKLASRGPALLRVEDLATLD